MTREQWKLLKNIANSLDDMIQMTVDFPSNHPDDKVPILDLKAWIDDDKQIAQLKFNFQLSNA